MNLLVLSYLTYRGRGSMLNTPIKERIISHQFKMAPLSYLAYLVPSVHLVVCLSICLFNLTSLSW